MVVIDLLAATAAAAEGAGRHWQPVQGVANGDRHRQEQGHSHKQARASNRVLESSYYQSDG